jgi:hypothetical protein
MKARDSLRQKHMQIFLEVRIQISLDKSDRSGEQKCNLGGRAEGFVVVRLSRTVSKLSEPCPSGYRLLVV